MHHRVDRVLCFFSSRWNRDSPTPLPQESVPPPPLDPGGWAHSLAVAGEGVGTRIILYNRWIGPRRATSALRSLCIKWNTVGGNGQVDLLAKHTRARGRKRQVIPSHRISVIELWGLPLGWVGPNSDAIHCGTLCTLWSVQDMTLFCVVHMGPRPLPAVRDFTRDGSIGRSIEEKECS